MASPRRRAGGSGPRGSFTVRMMHRARQIERGMATVKQDVVVVLVGTLSRFTPKLTGRARANWNVGIGAPDLSVDLDGPFRSSEATEAEARIRAARAKTGQSIEVSNALPYIRKLNRGSSRKAPAGFVERAVRVARQVAHEGRFLDRLKGGQ